MSCSITYTITYLIPEGDARNVIFTKPSRNCPAYSASPLSCLGCGELVSIRRPRGVLDESEVKPPFFPPFRPQKTRTREPARGEGGHAFCFSWRTPSLHEAALTLLGANSAVCRHTLHTFPLFAPKTCCCPPPSYPLYPPPSPPPFFAPKTCRPIPAPPPPLPPLPPLLLLLLLARLLLRFNRIVLACTLT